MRRTLISLTLAGLVAGCATKQLVPDFTTFSEAYARDLNWQMLLNLARLDQGHPAYFMAIGEIRLERTQSSSLQGNVQSSHTASQNVATAITRTAQNVLSGSLTPNTSIQAKPSFVFIPLNSEDAARQLLSPISIDVFNTLYQQGWPVDQLLRVMVERIEFDAPDGQQHVLTNSPTRADSLESFTRFLRACEVVRELQKSGGLQLQMFEHETPPAEAATETTETPATPNRGNAAAGGPARGGGGGQRPPGGAPGKTAKPDNAPGKPNTYRFRAHEAVLQQVLEKFSHQPGYDAETIRNFGYFFRSTLAVGSTTTVDAAQPHDRRAPRSTLVLRSFRNVLDAVAQEQRAFDKIFPGRGLDPRIPPRQHRPIIRTDWGAAKDKKLLPPVTTIRYAGHNYQITDEDRDEVSLDARWNRDVFRLLIDLSSQVTVDITKFQRQVLELTQ